MHLTGEKTNKAKSVSHLSRFTQKNLGLLEWVGRKKLIFISSLPTLGCFSYLNKSQVRATGHLFSASFRDHCKPQRGWEEALEFVSWRVTIYATYLRVVRNYQTRRHTVPVCFLWFRTCILEAFSFLESTCAGELSLCSTECFCKGSCRLYRLILVHKLTSYSNK